MTLHFSHMGLTLGRTFTVLSLVPVGDPASGEVVRGDLHLDTVARQDADAVHAHLAAAVRQHLVAVLQFDLEHGVGEGLDDGPLQHDRVFLGLGQMDLPARTVGLRNKAGARTNHGAGRRDSIPDRPAPLHWAPASPFWWGESGGFRRILPTRTEAQGTVRTSGPSSVTAMVCSTWADRLPSRVTTVQPSSRVRVSGPPTFTMGSTANTIPARSSGPFPGGP